MKKIIKTNESPSPIGPYSQAVRVGDMLFTSGQIAIIPGTSELANNTIEQETKRVMDNLEAILKDASYEFSDVVKTTIFLSDMSLFSNVNEVYGKYFKDDFPARETIAVKGLPKNVNVEISMIAVKTN